MDMDICWWAGKDSSATGPIHIWYYSSIHEQVSLEIHLGMAQHLPVTYSHRHRLQYGPPKVYANRRESTHWYKKQMNNIHHWDMNEKPAGNWKDQRYSHHLHYQHQSVS